MKGAASAACAHQCQQAAERIAFEAEGGPVFAAVTTLPELTVGESGEQTSVADEERIGHSRERLRQPARERLPRFAVAPAVDARLRVATAVGGVGAGAGRDVPEIRGVRLDGDRPGVVAVAALVGRLPGLARVGAKGRASSAGFVGAARNAWVPGERVHVGLRAGTVVLPALTTVARAH